MAFLIGHAAPSARPQIVVPGMMPIVSPISSSRSRSFSRPLPALIRSSMRTDQRDRLVHDYDARRAKPQTADLARPVEIERRVELRFSEQPHADAAGDR